MSSYTIRNLEQIENSAETFGLDSGLDARFPSRELGCEKTGVSVQRLAPEFRIPFGHSHPEQEEVSSSSRAAGASSWTTTCTT